MIHTCPAAPIAELELRIAASALERSKSSGPDGITVEVYVQLWSVFGQFLTAAFNACHASPHPQFTMRQRTSDYTLVPKCTDPTDPANRRPLAGIKSDVRNNARAISSRFAAGLNPIIDATQTGFLPTR